MRIVHVVGARPNFMKASPVMSALSKKPGVEQFLVHTGQHYDKNMSDVFFVQLGLPMPDINLEIGSGSHANQTAKIMLALEPQMISLKPDLVLVYGDVNSALAATLVCSKIGIRTAHVEAGLRSFDRSMPEEVNRVISDLIADMLFTPSKDADENLRKEGIDKGKIRLVGNVMIDTLVRLLPTAKSLWPDMERSLNIRDGSYGLVTLHRPSNVDSPAALLSLMQALSEASRKLPLVFPVHPRTKARLEGVSIGPRAIQFCDPLGYLEFLCLQQHAKLVITDSGGIQEETTFLGVPCITVRENTERPVTISVGTNYLLGGELRRLPGIIDEILAGRWKKGGIPPLWDGSAGIRIADCLAP
jgi:UDP-N-acetylglucosamine 2-epimerase (non-hydrolysing)